MKKRILLLSIVLVSFTAFSFAADAPAISKNVISSFNKHFPMPGISNGNTWQISQGRVYYERYGTLRLL